MWTPPGRATTGSQSSHTSQRTARQTATSPSPRRDPSTMWRGRPAERSLWWCMASCPPRLRCSTSSVSLFSTTAPGPATRFCGRRMGGSLCWAASATSLVTWSSGTTTARSSSPQSKHPARQATPGLPARASSSPQPSSRACESTTGSRSGSMTVARCTRNNTTKKCTKSHGDLRLMVPIPIAPQAPGLGRMWLPHQTGLLSLSRGHTYPPI
mmetsp:Transcript_29347/g.57437  ORF Transcript_29347/g.57437 Transcript_29347/m.57437 type:complete len:212 (-) Transcript_29347:488-1123(-)